MKGAIELREAIALTIAKVTDHSPYPDPPWLRDGPSMHSSPCLLFPVSHVASHPSPERHPQLARAYTLPLPCLLSVLRPTTNWKPRGLQRNLPSGSGCGRWRKCTVSSSGKRRM